MMSIIEYIIVHLNIGDLFLLILDPSMNKIKEQLIRIFESKNTKEVPDLTLEDEIEIERGMNIKEMDKNDLIRLTIPFINGITRNSKDNIIKFIRNILELGIQEVEAMEEINILPETLIGHINKEQDENYKLIFDRILEGRLERKSKIKLNAHLKKMDFRYVDWEDKDYLHSMIEACLCKALLLLRTMINEDTVSRKLDYIEDNSSKKAKAYKLLNCGHLNPVEFTRKELLKRRINPTKTLDEYVEWLQANMKNESKELNKEKKEKTIEEQRKWDEFRDLKRNFRGNTKNIG